MNSGLLGGINSNGINSGKDREFPGRKNFLRIKVSGKLMVIYSHIYVNLSRTSRNPCGIQSTGIPFLKE
jgi:hypothetical protein